MCRAPADYRRPVSISSRPSRAADPNLRASDAERERVVERLREHAAAGRLAVEELEERLSAAFSARTRGDLEPLLADLPGRSPIAAPRPSRRRRHLPPAAVVALALIAIWALTGAGYFWPIWPVIGLFWWAMPWHRHRAWGCRPRHPDAHGGTWV